jgi:hypothetical protein
MNEKLKAEFLKEKPTATVYRAFGQRDDGSFRIGQIVCKLDDVLCFPSEEYVEWLETRVLTK